MFNLDLSVPEPPLAPDSFVATDEQKKQYVTGRH
jgi:hypothetical protein